MKRWTILACALVAVLALSGSAPGAGGKSGNALDMYRATLDAAQAAKLRQQGYDVASVHQSGGGTQIDLVLSAGERDRLASQGIKLGLIKNAKGQTVRQQAELMAADGYTVYRSYDERGGIRDELYSIARRNPGIVKLKVIGKTVQGREIIALKVTKDAKTVADGARPDVLYMGTIHAREWIATEVVRRELNYFVSNYGKNAEVTNLVNTRELWFLVVANPDGYQYTFDTERLWRKNLRDNNADGQITVGDGVDLNRNYDINWGYDEEGSSSQVSSDTFRGTAPASEPETQATQKLINDQKFKFLVTYHSYGPLLLYAFGWQIQTP
jgi:murein tripeptide amidase MpaA